MKKSVFIALGTAMLLSCACAKVVETAPEISDGVFAIVSDPVADNELCEITVDKDLTKAISADFKFTFATGDKINVFPVPKGDGVLNSEIVPDSENPSSAKFKSGSFTLNDQTYSAVYPDFSNNYSAAMSFTGQKQIGNNTTNHLSAFDYSWAKADIKDNAGTFALAHRVCWIKITIPAGKGRQFSSIKLSADEGIANTATLNVSTGEVSCTRTKSDFIELSLESKVNDETADYIEISGESPLVAYATIPAGIYTNLYIRAIDDKNVEWRFKTHKNSELKFGKYYQATLATEEPAEDTPFTRTGNMGIFGSTTSDSPSAQRSYNEISDYLCYGTTSDSRTCKFFSIKDNDFHIISVTPKELVMGDDYTVTYNNGKTTVSGTYTIVNKADGKVWFENKTQQSGYIIPVE